jgi:hypothetical protein
MHRQPFGWCRSFHHHVPWQARHHAPGDGGRVSAVLGICANADGRSLIGSSDTNRVLAW